METTQAELCNLLTDCLKKDEAGFEAAHLSGLSGKDWQAFLALAATQRVRPLLWHRLRQEGLVEAVPPEKMEKLRLFHLWNTEHNLRLYGELRLLLSALKPEGIPLILLKGIYLAEAVYGNMGLREMNDIDVLARPTDLSRIVEILVDMGYEPAKPVCTDLTLKTAHHLPGLFKKDHAKIEIHWNLTRPGESYSIDPGELWECAVPFHIAGCDTLALSPEDLLLHLCLHTSYQHLFAFGLRPFCDITETIAHFGSTLDWRIVTERAVRRGWQRGVYLALRLAREMVGADVPATILERLNPSDGTEAIRETAHTQVFTDKALTASIPGPLAHLLESGSLWNKIRIFRERVFLPKTEIAASYSVPVDSLRIYGCYPRRFVDILRRHRHILKKSHNNNTPTKEIAGRINLISRWLALQATPSNHRPQRDR